MILTVFSGDGPFASYKWQALFHDQAIFMKAFFYTFLLALCALSVGVLVGIFISLLTTSQNHVLRKIGRIYVAFFQNTPLLIQLFFLYFALPFVGLTLPVFLIGVIGIGLYHGAYLSEVIRTGIEAVPIGQKEASYSQGFNYPQTMIQIVLPQAFKIFLPAFTNQVVALIKNTSLIALITGSDLMFTANSWSGYNLYYGPAFALVGICYFILCYPLAKLASYWEKKNKLSTRS